MPQWENGRSLRKVGVGMEGGGKCFDVTEKRYNITPLPPRASQAWMLKARTLSCAAHRVLPAPATLVRQMRLWSSRRLTWVPLTALSTNLSLVHRHISGGAHWRLLQRNCTSQRYLAPNIKILHHKTHTSWPNSYCNRRCHYYYCSRWYQLLFLVCTRTGTHHPHATVHYTGTVCTSVN